MRNVPVGRRNLFADRRRALLGVAGVSAALLMVLALEGIFAGAMRQITRYIDTSPATLFVAQRGVRNMHMTSSALPLETAGAIAELPGVDWADPILFESDALRTASGRQISYVFGYVPGRRGGPVEITEGRAPAEGQIVLDGRAARSLGAGIGDDVGIMGRDWRVSGLTSSMTNIVNTVSYVRFEDFARVRGLEGVASYILVGGGDPGEIRALTGLEVLDRATFSAQEARIVEDMATELMQIMSFAAFLIGLAVTGLTLYAATLSRLREVGVMKALGARPPALTRIVLSQAVWTVGGALVIAVILTLGLGWVVEQVSANVSLVVEVSSVLKAAAGAAVLGALGATGPLIKVSRVDPASVFRRAA